MRNEKEKGMRDEEEMRWRLYTKQHMSTCPYMDDVMEPL